MISNLRSLTDPCTLNFVDMRGPRSLMNATTLNIHGCAQLALKVVMLSLFCTMTSSYALADQTLEVLAARQIRSGSLSVGRETLLNAIAWNNSHAAKGKSVGLEAAKRCAVDWDFGKQQLQLMLTDRPNMRENIRHLGPIKDWAICSFGGGLTGFRIEWSSKTPSMLGAEAEHYAPWGRKNASIRIASTKKCHETGLPRSLTCEELWHHLVFECFNASETVERDVIDKRAAVGAISRDAYILAMFATEYRAVQMTHKFYADVYLLCAAQANLVSDPKVWFVEHAGWWKGPSEMLQVYPKNGYPWIDFGPEYDFLRTRSEISSLFEKHSNGSGLFDE